MYDGVHLTDDASFLLSKKFGDVLNVLHGDWHVCVTTKTSSGVLENTCNFSKIQNKLMNDTSEVVEVVNVDIGSVVCNHVPSFSYPPTCKNTLSTPEMENNIHTSTNTASSFCSFSAAAIKKTPHCVSLKKSSLHRRG